MCDYKIMDVSIYSDILQLSRNIVDEFLLQNFNNKNKLIRKYVDKHPIMNCFGLCRKNTIVIDSTIYDKLIQTASSILHINGFKTEILDEDKNSIELLYIDSNNHEVESDFIIHCDNDAYSKKKVQTLILYYHIDCDGGDLEIYSYNGLFKGYKLEDTIEPKTDDTSKRRIVMMSGETYHYPTKVYNGKRIAIVYNIKAA